MWVLPAFAAISLDVDFAGAVQLAVPNGMTVGVSTDNYCVVAHNFLPMCILVVAYPVASLACSYSRH